MSIPSALIIVRLGFSCRLNKKKDQKQLILTPTHHVEVVLDLGEQEQPLDGILAARHDHLVADVRQLGADVLADVVVRLPIVILLHALIEKLMAAADDVVGATHSLAVGTSRVQRHRQHALGAGYDERRRRRVDVAASLHRAPVRLPSSVAAEEEEKKAVAGSKTGGAVFYALCQSDNASLLFFIQKV